MGIYKGIDVSEKEYDVVIVGAGIAGALLAKELSVKGHTVLILESGIGQTYNQYHDNVNHYYSTSIKVPNSPYFNNPNSPQPSGGDIVSNIPLDNSKGYFIQKGPMPYFSDYTRVFGGTTLHWLGTCLRMLPEDFSMASKFGIGLDWPLKYTDLYPYYKRAELEIGVAGDLDEQRELERLLGLTEKWFSEEDIFPMHKIPQSYLDQYFKNGLNNLDINLDGETFPVRVTSTPQGRNGIPNEKYKIAGRNYKTVGAVGSKYQGHRCQGYSSCVPICPVQAKYNAMKTLEASLKSGRVDIITQAVASKIETDQNGIVKSIIYKMYKNKNIPEYTVGTANGKMFILAAGAIENSSLLLASSIGGEKVGKYLMDHPFLLTWGLAPINLGTYRGPGSTSGIETLRSGKRRENRSAFRIEISNLGWNWPKGAPQSLIRDLVFNENLLGDTLKKRVFDLSQRQVQLGFLLDQPADVNNKILIDSRYKDALDNFRPVIQYSLCDYTLEGIAKAKQVSDLIFEHLNVEDYSIYSKDEAGYIEYKGKGYAYKGAGHFMGGHIMGNSKHNSVVNHEQKLWGWTNLYAVGCGSMPTSGTANPTLTMAALALMTAEKINLKLLKAKESLLIRGEK